MFEMVIDIPQVTRWAPVAPGLAGYVSELTNTLITIT